MVKSNPMYYRIDLFLFLIFIFLNSILAQDFQIGGYTKFLASSAKFSQINENLTDFTLHSRFNAKYFINDYITFSSALRSKIVYGETIEKFPFLFDRFSQKDYLIELDCHLWKRKKTINYVEIDRLWFDLNLDNLQLNIGRQRIAWGTSWVWNITDIFNPLSILDFDYEERPAVDAFRLQYFPTTTLKFDFAFKPEKEIEKSSVALQFFYNKIGYDFYLMLGYHRERFVSGFSWSGDISGAGFRGEILFSDAPGKMSFGSSNIFSIQNKKQLSVVLSGDYTFANSLYIHSELLYNNLGMIEHIGLYSKDASEIGLLSASRINLFYQLGYNLTALTRLDLSMIHNPYDKSFVLLPTVSISLLQNLDLSFISLYFNGEDFSEYSPKGIMLYSRLKYSF